MNDKSEILQIGSGAPDYDGWVFDCHGKGIGLEIRLDGSEVLGGYTHAELDEIVRTGVVPDRV